MKVSTASEEITVDLGKLEKARLLRRYKRFLADVVLADGRELTVHCPNPGSMIGCAEPGSSVLIRPLTGTKLPYAWVGTVCGEERVIVNVDTMMANRLMYEAFSKGAIAETAGYKHVQKEFTFGDSRFDFCLRDHGSEKDCLVEVKSTTLTTGRLAMFPDAKTERGLKHLRGLTAAVKDGWRAVQFFLVARSDVDEFAPADHIDPAYGSALREARAQGVEILIWTTKTSCAGNRYSVTLSKPAKMSF
jgi:sugar fermentation stimulation protein A